MLLTAPTWARLGLSVRDERLRERAADAMAARIVQGLEGIAEPDPRQLVLHLDGQVGR
ncbi:DUF6771 family protein [Sphingomonas sp. AP4-R1]|uniref:DUF6771 family protein n=1 Tax=Sphingomonas sp. AP4-R1 TaxID=2735134 RepID=UPI0034633D0C